jgi:hypothetical protein
MIVSEARIKANRENALKSTGPKTDEGKQKSRLNAITHGLCTSVVVPEDARTVTGRALQFFDTLRPQNDFHCWVVSEVSLTTFKIDRAERMDRRVRDKIAIKAELSWDEDRKLEVEYLGEQLGNRPAIVVEKLKATPQGCEWMMTRWAMLAYCADCKRPWTPAQVQLAFDLLATPADFREGHNPGVAIDTEGRVIDAGDDPAAVARREIQLLKIRIEQVAPLDEANRCLAMADLNDDHDPELKRVRRYEGSLHSRLRWCINQLQKEGPPREIPRWLKVKWLGNQDEFNVMFKAKLEAEAEAASPPEPEPAAQSEVAAKPATPTLQLEPLAVTPIDFEAISTNRPSRNRKNLDDLRASRRRKAERRLGA